MSISCTNQIKKTLVCFLLCSSQLTYGSENVVDYFQNKPIYQPETTQLCVPEVESCIPEVQPIAEESSFIISAELLYLKPSIEQSSYAISSTNNVVAGEFFPNGRRHFNNSDYRPGFRLGALYKPCCDSVAFELRFAHLCASHTSSTSGPFLFDTIGFPGDGAQAPEDNTYSGTARIRDKYSYYAADLTLNRLGLCSCIDNLYLIVGLHYANIQHTTHFTSFGTSISDSAPVPVLNTLRRHSNFWGIGPEFGMDYSYDLTSPDSSFGAFALKADVRGALLCSQSDASFHYDTTRTVGTEGVNLRNDEVWHVTPTFDAKLGATYEFSCWNMNSSIELGYEWLWYSNSIDSIIGYDVAFAGDSLDVYNNLSLHGPYLKINVAF